MKKPKQPIFLKSTAGVAFCFLLSLYLFHRATKSKTDFEKVKGVVEYIEASSPLSKNNNPARFRFLKVAGYAKPFELFIGKEWGDFKPEFEKMDALHSGDNVVVYYNENLFTQNEPVNRLVYFIDRNNEPIFVKGSWETGPAYFIAGFSLLLFFWLLYLKKKGKID